MSFRPASKAGSWYSANPDRLASELDGYLDILVADQPSVIIGAIVPHAGLAFSGATAAKAYALIRSRAEAVETIIIFGAVHTCYLDRPAIWAEGEWETPLGNVVVDEELAARLVDAGVGEASEIPHLDDNAIELQMPFIRHCFPGAKVVPVAMPAASVAVEAGITAQDVVSRVGRRVVVVGSTDLTHYGRSFGVTPAGSGQVALDWSMENDRKILDLMLSMRAEDIVPVAKRDHSACGAGAAAATVAYCRASGCADGELLEHITSHDVMPDGEASHFVGYGAVVFSG